MTVLPRIVSSWQVPTPESPPPSLTPGPLLPVVLHFDINETIVLGDEAGDDTRDDSIHKLIAKSVFVRIPEEFYNGKHSSLEDTDSVVPTHWWDGTPLSLPKANAEVGSHDDGDKPTIPPLYTGWEWPPGCCPYYRTAYKNDAKRFVERHGWCFKGLHDEVNRILRDAHDHLPPALSHILPALFDTVVELTRRRQNDFDFRIVFRTFGTDLDTIAEAMTLFATGQHPDYPNFVEERFALNRDDLVRGRWDEQSDGTITYKLYSYDGTQTIASGDEQVLQWLESKPVCGIQDDYLFWSLHGFAPWAGKPVWVPDGRQHEHHILLDDNIHNLSGKSIAGIRTKDTNTGKFHTLSGEETRDMQGIHLIRVPTIEPLLRPKWFLEKIENARRRYKADMALKLT